MNIKNIKLSRKALLFLISGTISINSGGCGVITTISDDEITLEDNIVDDELTTEVSNLDLNELDIKKGNLENYDYKYLDNTYGYLKDDEILRKDKTSKSDKIAKIKKFEKVKLISKSNGWDYVLYEDNEGYIKDKKIAKILKEFIEIDISEQKLRYYDDDGDIIISSDVVTGCTSNDHDTREGYFEIFAKNTDRYLKGPGYCSYVNYFMPFDGGIGLHDADRWRNQYGGEIYKNDGSHGCVNMPYEKVKKIYQEAQIGTKVLVHR